jgi:hypothetical protein
METIKVTVPSTPPIYCTLSNAGYSGISGYSGFSGQDGVIGHDGLSGYSGYSGESASMSGYSGYSGIDGEPGYVGESGFSGYSGFDGASGYSGWSGSGFSGFSGYSGMYSTILNVHQVGHGLIVGNVIRITGTNTYAKAQADTADNAEAVGVCTEVGGLDDFTYMEFGIWNSPSVPNIAGGSVLFLDDAVSGGLTSIEPSVEGHVSKPIGVMLQAQTAMLILITRGAVIGRGFGGKFTINPKTNDYAVTRENVAITFTMDSLSPHTFFLPYVDGSNLGIWYTFVKLGSGAVTIKAYGTDVIAESSPGGTATNSQATELFSSITIQFVSVGKWIITASTGTWTLA